jgi:hypothetical protein
MARLGMAVKDKLYYGRSSGIRRLWTRKPATCRASVLAEVAEVAVAKGANAPHMNAGS